MRCVIFDLDGTLADMTERRKLIDGNDMGAFFDAIGTEESVYPIWCLYHMVKRQVDIDILLVTGRHEKHRRATEMWLDSKDVKDYKVLLMRENFDNRQDDIVKREILYEKILPEYEVLFVVDDRQRVVDMWRSEGITCLQCAPGDFDAGKPHDSTSKKGPAKSTDLDC